MMADEIKILCVDDERNVLKSLRRIFMDEDNYEIFLAESGNEGLEILEQEDSIRIVISDYRMPEMNGVEFLHQVNQKWPETIRIVLSGYADTASVVEAINEGQIYKFIPKPWNDEELLSTISSALEHQNLQFENKKLNIELKQKNQELQAVNDNLEGLVVKRTEALDIRNQVLQVSQAVMDVLPIAVLGIDLEQMIVHCNEFARDLFPHGIIGPLGNDRSKVFSAEINALIDRQETDGVSTAVVNIQESNFYAEVRPLYATRSQGVVVILIPKLLVCDEG